MRGGVALDELLQRPRARRRSVRELFAERLPRALASLRAVSPRPVDAGAWERLLSDRAQGSRPAGPELLAAILAAPQDLGLRAAYGDWLIERGEPRGEFFQLQLQAAREPLSGARARRARALQARHQRDWLGLWLHAVLQNVRFAGGFLEGAELAQNSAADAGGWRRAVEDERLATLRELRKGRGNARHYGAFLASPLTAGLVSVDAPDKATLGQLIERSERRLLELRCARRPGRPQLAAMASAPAFSSLRRLSISSHKPEASLEDLAGCGLLDQLEALHLDDASYGDGPFVPVAALGRASSLPRSLRRFSVSRGQGAEHVLLREDDGWTFELGWTIPERLPSMIELLPLADLRGVVAVAISDELGAAALETLRRLLPDHVELSYRLI